MYNFDDNDARNFLDKDEFDFDQWRELYQLDPEEFEKRRAELIEATIADAPEEYQRRLRGLMFEVEAKRSASATPLEACMAISNMMWDKFDELRLHLNAIARPETLTDEEKKSIEKPSSAAQVLPFKSR